MELNATELATLSQIVADYKRTRSILLQLRAQLKERIAQAQDDYNAAAVNYEQGFELTDRLLHRFHAEHSSAFAHGPVRTLEGSLSVRQCPPALFVPEDFTRAHLDTLEAERPQFVRTTTAIDKRACLANLLSSTPSPLLTEMGFHVKQEVKFVVQ